MYFGIMQLMKLAIGKLTFSHKHMSCARRINVGVYMQTAKVQINTRC